MDMRDRLAEDIRSVMRESHGPDGPIDLRGDDPHEWMADRLITLGWTRPDMPPPGSLDQARLIAETKR